MAYQDVNRFFDLDNSYKNCGHCRYWMGAHGNLYSADFGGTKRLVGCCSCPDEGSPVASDMNGDAIVFTASSATCPAFSIIPEVWEDIQEDRALYHRLDMDIRRDALSAW